MGLMLKRINLKYTCLILLLCISIGVAHYYQSSIIHWIKVFFEFPELNLYAGGIATIITVCHRIRIGKLTFSPAMSFNEFKKPMEELLSFLSNPITIVCSLSLAKGLFLQISEHIAYFPYFNELEIVFTAIVTAYLLYVSIMDLGKRFLETISNSDTEMPIPKTVDGGEKGGKKT
jgi:hypothetical protein